MPNQNPQSSVKPSSTRIIVLLALLAVVIIAAVALNHAQKGAQTPPAAPNLANVQAQPESRSAKLTVVPIAEGSPFVVGEQNNRVELRLDTMGQYIAVIEAYLTYDPAAVEVTDVVGRGSVFPLEVTSSQKSLEAPGIVHIVRGIPRDARTGMTGFAGEGLVATLIVKPLRVGEIKFMVDTQKSKYVPGDAEEMFAFSDVTDGQFTVTE